jgi:TonB-linked SusC/RagA family outer membrane protein
MKKILSLTKSAMILLFLFSLPIYGQSQTISGTVLDADKKTPLAGVTIKVLGTKTTEQTKENGSFSIQASKGQNLLVSYVGYESQRVNVKEGNITVSLISSVTELEEVVVAMDIKRKPRELGYSVQKVTGKDIAESQRENFVNSLQGRIAGASITSTGGQAGASSNIVLRGFNSMALSNQPLFVIDGVIVDNQTVNETSNGGSQLGLASDKPNRNNDYTNRIADVNPNDIENVTVLKGPEATALYGSQASSGAIVITTKKAKSTGKIGVNYDNSFRMQKINRFPSYSNMYGQGNFGLSDKNVFSYFGPATSPDSAIYDNVKNFFQRGLSQTHNISLEYGKKKTSWRFSGSAFMQDGVVPNNTFNRYNLRLSNTTKIGKYIDVSPAISYINSNNQKPLRGAGGYLLNLMLWPMDNNITNFVDSNAIKIKMGNNEFDNPLFSANNNRSYDKTDRVLTTLGININPTSWLTISGRFGYDYYRSTGYTIIDSLSSLALGTKGSQDNYYRNYYGYNHTITATAKKTFGDFSTRLMVGNMWQDYETQMYAVSGFFVKGDYRFASDSNNTRETGRARLSNSIRTGGYNLSINRQNAFFGEAAVSYKNLAFLSYSHRFENSSIFPADYRNYNYPAGSISFIMSDIFPSIKKSGINYFKLRGSLAQTARSSAPYANQSVFNFALSSGGGYTYAFNNNNYYLEPERQKTYEIGAEFKLLNNKIGLDVTYYNTLNEKQIAENFRASYGTGYVLNTLNVGSTRNTGIEISLDASPIQNKNFGWNFRLNFNRMRNEVLSLPANVPEFYISDTWLYANARGGLIQGGASTSITSWGYQRNLKGDILIDPANGLPLIDQNFRVRGDRNPNFTLGILNNFRYKNWTLNMLWDLKVGGDIFNGTDMFLTTRGKSIRNNDRATSRIITGVLNDGLQNTTSPTKNNIVVKPYDLQAYYISRMPEEEFIQRNVNWLRLRDITLNYLVDPKRIKNLSFLKSLGLFVTGNDLILITNYLGADPAVNGNTAGSRGVGGFGFDYGNIGTPISVNVGLKAGF